MLQPHDIVPFRHPVTDGGPVPNPLPRLLDGEDLSLKMPSICSNAWCWEGSNRLRSPACWSPCA